MTLLAVLHRLPIQPKIAEQVQKTPAFIGFKVGRVQAMEWQLIHPVLNGSNRPFSHPLELDPFKIGNRNSQVKNFLNVMLIIVYAFIDQTYDVSQNKLAKH
jgi:hypothetical protein